MKILYIITRGDTLAGAQRHVYEMSQRVNGEYANALVVSGVGEAFASLMNSTSTEHIQIPELIRNVSPWNDCLAIIKIRKLVKEFDPDIVSIHSSKAGLVGRLACIGLKKSVIFTAHGWSFTEGVGAKKQIIFSLIEKQLSRLTNVIVCVSDYDRNLAIENGLSYKKLVTIHNGRHDKPSGVVVRKEKDAPVVIVMIGRLDEQKDHATLFYALQSLKGYELKLVGDGPKLQTLKQLAADLKIVDRVHFVGLVENVHTTLSQSDVFCLISNWEGFPRSTLEAMSHSLPVVVSCAGGSAEAVKDGVTGFIVQKGDVAGLNRSIKILLGNESLRKEMGLNGRAMFENQFTFQTMFDKTAEVYNKLLESNTKKI